MKKIGLLLSALLLTIYVEAKEVVYRIVEYNTSTQEFTLAASGEIPYASSAYFLNDFGATTGNRYNQIPRNKKAQLVLNGWAGCKINRLTFNMCSNNKSGTIGFEIVDGDSVITKQNAVEFADEKWYGQWVSKDLGIYVDIVKNITDCRLLKDFFIINLKAGTQEGSVYINSITIEYDTEEDAKTESPMGWIYEKLEKKSTLNIGDVVMIYRQGNAAADFDGMETSHYLDVVGIVSTSKVTEPDVERFTLGKDSLGKYWTLTDQYGRMLGATGKQALAWDNGKTGWTITLGYNGAEITNENTNYGTIRFNAPESSYARFWNYTSTSLPLPYLYRQSKRVEAVKCTKLTFPSETMTVDLSEGVIALKPDFSPTTTTDTRLLWESSNTNVADVDCGLVNLNSKGETLITATTRDGSLSAQILLNVDDTDNITTERIKSKDINNGKYLNEGRIFIVKDRKTYDSSGRYINEE